MPNKRRLELVKALRRQTSDTRTPSVGEGDQPATNVLRPERLQQVFREEPLTRRGINKHAGSVVKEWFQLTDPKDQDQEHPENQAFQAWAKAIQLKRKAKLALVDAHVYGDGLFELEWDDEGDSDAPIPADAVLLDVHVIDPATVTLRRQKDDNGLWRTGLTQRAGGQTVVLHPDRLRHFKLSELSGHIGGLSTIEAAFHTAISKIASDQSLGDLVRHCGVPLRHGVITNGSPEEIDALWAILKSPKLNRGIVTDDRTVVNQLNPTVINVEPFYDAYVTSLAAAIGLPKMMLTGAQAGQLTGSQVNLDDFHGDLTEVRENVLDPFLRDVVVGTTRLDPAGFDLWWHPFPKNMEAEARALRDKSVAFLTFTTGGVAPMAAARLLDLDLDDEDLGPPTPRVPGFLPPTGLPPKAPPAPTPKVTV